MTNIFVFAFIPESYMCMAGLLTYPVFDFLPITTVLRWNSATVVIVDCCIKDIIPIPIVIGPIGAAYSSGYCSGFTPDSLFKHINR